MKLVGYILILTTICTSVYGQNHEDALRYSYNNLYGSARSNAMSNAFDALGGDFSSISSNPAGIGIFRHSEFTFSPEVQLNTFNTLHYGTENEDQRFKLKNNQIGYVGVIKTKNTVSGWLNVNMGFGMNQINSFNNKITISGYNDDNSLIDSYVNTLNNYPISILDNIHEDPRFYQGPNLAWQNYLINVDPDTEKPFYRAFGLNENLQTNTSIETGKIKESFFSIGANYSNEIYIGLTIGSPRVKYSRQETYTEQTEMTDSLTLFESFTLNETLNTEGRGYNAKLGIIFRPSKSLRLGFSFHSPTQYTLTDNWSTTMKATFSDTNYSYSDPDGKYKYGLITPYRMSLSAANIFGKLGLISAQAELIDYTSMRLFSLDGSYNFTEENNNIENYYTVGLNLKAGAELRLGHYAIRGGYGFIQGAYKNGTNHTYNASIGAGYRDEKFYFDVAYSISYKTDQLYLYDHENLMASSIENNLHRVTTTFGIRF